MPDMLIRILTSRRLVQTLFIGASGLLLAVAVTEQAARRVATEGDFGIWGFISRLEVARVVSSWWFFSLVILFLFSLLLSTFQQFAAALRQMRSIPDTIPAGADRLEERPIAMAAGYRRVVHDATVEKYVAAPWGYFGRAVLHLGLGIAITCSAVYFFTEHRVIVRVVEGLAVPLSEATRAVSRGGAAGSLDLPASLRLVDVAPVYWENDQLQQLRSAVEMSDPSGALLTTEVGLSAKGRYNGMILYQQGDFGRAFFLEGVSDDGMPVRQVLTIPMPATRDKAGYESFPFAPGLELKAKFYADAGRAKMVSDMPELVLRLMAGSRIAGEATFLPGDTARLGTYTLFLREARWWTELLFEGSRGATGIFLGFFLMVSGALVTYFSAPRELFIWRTGGGIAVFWRATRFAEFYAEEKLVIMHSPGESHGK